MPNRRALFQRYDDPLQYCCSNLYAIRWPWYMWPVGQNKALSFHRSLQKGSVNPGSPEKFFNASWVFVTPVSPAMYLALIRSPLGRIGAHVLEGSHVPGTGRGTVWTTWLFSDQSRTANHFEPPRNSLLINTYFLLFWYPGKTNKQSLHHE